jgi:hypothetical protein
MAEKSPTPVPAPEPKEEPKEVKPTKFEQPHVDLTKEVTADMPPDRVLDIVLGKDEIIPWEEVTLPSLGVYYQDEKGGELIPGGKIHARAMGIYADKVLATARLHQGFQAIDWLFKKCVKFPASAGAFDPGDLLNGDRMFLLYYLRGITHGPDYEFLTKCTDPECGIASTHNYNLAELVTTINRPKKDLGKEPFKVSLPYLSKVTGRDFWVKIRLLRGRDVTAMLLKRGNQKALRPQKVRARSEKVDEPLIDNSITLDQTVSQNLSLVIVEAMGNDSRAKIDQLVEKLHAEDTATIREFLNDAAPGIDFQVIVTCPHCSTEMTMDLPITESFFRPTKRGGD